ncbi:glutaredoxin family protein [Shewanella salipaludis]|uniref:Glutaredoxin family protein n=1 Tax=Shewanella salipaludis TaxID=2723052 RepID=A0A972FYE9_9GAMM|nr:glutaredoxin family protein [Shewanella salipaludis]NMH64186.1 glutaredoxin family protein [Shewanella salipaludis]
MSESATSYLLFHTQGCHLCELAQALVQDAAIAFSRRDICDDDTLAERYGTLIPVLMAPDGRELNWPFDAKQLKEFTGA